MKTLNYNTRFIQLAGEINTAMPRYWVEKVQDALNEAGKSVKGGRVLVLGVAYKKDIDTAFNLEARYPDFKRSFRQTCTPEYTAQQMSVIKELMQWLRYQLPSSAV